MVACASATRVLQPDFPICWEDSVECRDVLAAAHKVFFSKKKNKTAEGEMNAQFKACGKTIVSLQSSTMFSKWPDFTSHVPDPLN